MKLCLELGADINAANSMGLTALLGAANRGSNDIIELLADARRAPGRQGRGRAHAAALGGRRFSCRGGRGAQAGDDRAARAAQRRSDPLAIHGRRSSRRRSRAIVAALGHDTGARSTPSGTTGHGQSRTRGAVV